jgi:hypothetical protein
MAETDAPVPLRGATKRFRTTTAVEGWAASTEPALIPFTVIETVSVVFFLRRDVSN